MKIPVSFKVEQRVMDNSTLDLYNVINAYITG